MILILPAASMEMSFAECTILKKIMIRQLVLHVRTAAPVRGYPYVTSLNIYHQTNPIPSEYNVPVQVSDIKGCHVQEKPFAIKGLNLRLKIMLLW